MNYNINTEKIHLTITNLNGDVTEIYYIIPSSSKGYYILVKETAFQEVTSNLVTSDYILNQFNIKIDEN